MLTLMDAGSLACNYGILGLDVPEQMRRNRQLLQLNSENVEGSDDGGSSLICETT